ncbi:hypothetical protein ACWERV_23140 [Streptomyces sp. NPDC004031]
MLGRQMRGRLAGAVRALLDATEGAPDPVRLAVLVLASRTPSGGTPPRVLMRSRWLGEWLGLSLSQTASAVMPVLRRSPVVDVVDVPGEYGQDDLLAFEVVPVRAARGVVGHPLALSRTELAVLWRLVDAVMRPAIAYRDGRAGQAGLLGARTGRGAATDRLALLLLLLEASEQGRVRLCGGAVVRRYGRAVTTLARLLGCGLDGAAGSLRRLADAGLVERVRRPDGRTRLVLPAVRAAHRGGPAPAGSADADGVSFTKRSHEARQLPAGPEEGVPAPSRCSGFAEAVAAAGGVSTELWWAGWDTDDASSHEDFDGDGRGGASADDPGPLDGGEQSDGVPGDVQGVVDEGVDAAGACPHGDTAGPDQTAAPEATAQVTVLVLREGAGQSAHGDTAGLHTHHSPVVEVVGDGAAGCGFSGEAAYGYPPLPERAHKDVNGGAGDRLPVRPKVAGTSGGPLRGEQQPLPPAVNHRHEPQPAYSGAGCSEQSAGAVGRVHQQELRGHDQQRGRVPRPPDDLVAVVAPAAALWDRLVHRGARGLVVAALRRELTAVTAAADDPDRAVQLLAARLERRLAVQDGPDQVRDPVGWLLRRGLPRGGAGCTHPRCDEGTRMDTGLPCEMCRSRIAGQRALRERVTAEVAADRPNAPQAVRRREVERRLREETAKAAEQRAVRLAASTANRAAPGGPNTALQEARLRDGAQTTADAETAAAKKLACGGGCGRAAADRISGLCPLCAEETRDLLVEPELEGLDAAGQKLMLRLVRGHAEPTAVRAWTCRESSCGRRLHGVPPESGRCAPCERTVDGLPAPYRAAAR